VSEDLISLYGLTDIASTVARKDPLTGAKINKLRKSYEGKVKTLGLNGRNKPTTIPGELMGFMEWPEEGWFDQRVYGKELERALDDNNPLLQKLDRAVAMREGQLPKDEHEKWKAVLGFDEPLPSAPAVAVGKTGAPLPRSASVAASAAQASFARSGQALSTGMRGSAPSSPRTGAGAGTIRPDRMGKKRRYDDASFEGYSESGLESDGGVGVDGDRRISAGKKRRRVS